MLVEEKDVKPLRSPREVNDPAVERHLIRQMLTVLTERSEDKWDAFGGWRVRPISHLEMKMWPVGVAGITDQTKDLASTYLVAGFHPQSCFQMPISGVAATSEI